MDERQKLIRSAQREYQRVLATVNPDRRDWAFDGLSLQMHFLTEANGGIEDCSLLDPKKTSEEVKRGLLDFCNREQFAGYVGPDI